MQGYEKDFSRIAMISEAVKCIYMYIFLTFMPLFRCSRLHVPVVGRRLPLQPPPLLRPRRGSRHAPRPLLISQGELRVKHYLVMIRRFTHIVCQMELTVRAVLGPDPVLQFTLSALA